MKFYFPHNTFDLRFFILILIGNGLIVFGINFFGDTNTVLATKAGIIQTLLSGIIAGFTVPYTKSVATLPRRSAAYGRGAVLVATGAGLCGLAVHGYFDTPNITATITWIVGANLVGSSLLIASKRGHHKLPVKLQGLNNKL